MAFLAVSCARESPTPTAAVIATPRHAATPTPIISTDAAGRRQIIIYLSESTGAYQTGEAILTDLGATTRVTVNVEPSMPAAQPIHIHEGTCAEVGGISEKLEDVVVGSSETEVPEPLTAIATGGTVINVHLSYSDIRTYTACGQIPALR